jgi:hypothetical protein
MFSYRSLFAVLAFGGLLSLAPSMACAQESKSERQTSLSDVPILQRVALSHPGCVTCNDSILANEEKYLNEHLKERPRVESVYQQKSVDDMKQALEDFWRERGIAVEVSSKLTQVTTCAPRAPHYAALEIQVYRKY